MKGKKPGSLVGLSEIHKQVLSGGSDTQKLSTSDIVMSSNVRNKIDKSAEDFLSLKSSIETRGIIQPVTVKEEGGKYLLIAGYRRVTAYSELVNDGVLKDGDIPVYIVEINDEVDYSAVQLIENIQREDLDIFDKGFGFHSLFAFSGDESEPQEILSKLLIDYKNNTENDVITYFVKTGLVPSIRSVITAYQAICLPAPVIALLRGRKEFHLSLVGVLYDNRELEALPQLVENYVNNGFARDQLIKAIFSAKKRPATPAAKKKQVSFVSHFDKLIKSANIIIEIASDDSVRVKKKKEALGRIATLRDALNKAEELLTEE